MDHLPLPANADPPKIEVPFVCTIVPNTAKEFCSYPASHGLDVDQDGIIDVEGLFKLSVHEQLCFVQAWLYFAPLQLICGSILDIGDFKQRQLIR